MNDMNNYDDEIFMEEEEEIEEEKQPSGREKLLKIGLIAVVIAVVVVVVLVSVLLKSNSGDSDTTTLPADETTTLAEEITTSPAERYAAGKYTVNVAGNGTLNLRKEASMDADPLSKIPNNTQLNITEVKYDETAEDESSRYWGKTSYLGHDGWVAMQYLAAAYIDNMPDETTQGSSETTTATTSEETTNTEATTAAATETTTVKEETTTASSSSSNAGDTGTYKVNSPDVGYLNMRDGHSTDSTSIAQIPDGAEITISEVYESTDPNASVKVWGKTTYGGQTGWVAMSYLAN